MPLHNSTTIPNLLPHYPRTFPTLPLPHYPPASFPFVTGHFIAFQPLQPCCLNILPPFSPPRNTAIQLPFLPSMVTTLPSFSAQDLPREQKITLKQHSSTRQTGQTCVTNNQAARLIMGGSPFCFNQSSLAVKLLP